MNRRRSSIGFVSLGIVGVQIRTPVLRVYWREEKVVLNLVGCGNLQADINTMEYSCEVFEKVTGC